MWESRSCRSAIGCSEHLGVLGEMRKRFVRKPGVRFLNGNGTTSTTWCFNRVIRNESYRSFQVARAEFDRILLRNAVRLGAEVREGVRVKEVDVTSAPDEVTVRSVDDEGNEKAYRARFLFDASDARRRSRRGSVDDSLFGSGAEGVDLGVFRWASTGLPPASSLKTPISAINGNSCSQRTQLTGNTISACPNLKGRPRSPGYWKAASSGCRSW
jgi:hypothetical protein